VTLKVSACGAYDQEEAKHELAVMRKLHDSNAKHKGFQYIRTYDDTFEVEGPVGTHVVSRSALPSLMIVEDQK